ncbi:MAG TPA: ATP-binding protein [Candidatus Limnocylindrales bacterium]|nr:ATP-binding protein [Candidatus Limnocylindrales bacterium]
MPDTARLHRLHEAVADMLGELDLRAVGDVIVRTAIQSEGVDAVALMLAEEGADEMTILAHRGLSERYAAEQRIPLAAARASHADITAHVTRDLRREALGDRALIAAEGLAKVHALPVVHAGAFVGSLNLYTKDPARELDAKDVEVAHILAAHAGAALSSARLYAEAVAAREFHTALVESLAEPVLVARPPGVLSAANAAARALVGFADDLIGRPLDAVAQHFSFRAAPDDALVEAGANPLSRALRGEELAGEYRVTDPATGEDRTIEVSARPVRDARRRIVAAVSALHDVSAARAAEREKEEFVSMVSHELKTPLTPLKALAQLLRARVRRSREGRPLDLESLERNLLGIERQADRMNRLVSDLLEVSRAGRGSFELVPRPFDLAAAVRDVANRYAEAAAAQGPHRFDVRTPERIVVDGDQTRLEQVLLNLLDNAVKYSPRGGLVRVTLEAVEGEVELVVSDEGIGITAGDLARIGHRFVRGTGRAATFAGLGVGLHVCELVAAKHGGSLRLESEGEDRGTVARVRLPLRG